MTHFNAAFSLKYKNAEVLPLEITADIIFGNPSQDCQGHGVCLVCMTEHINIRWRCPSAKANISLSGNGEVCFFFPFFVLPPAYRATYFGDDRFIVSEPYQLPKGLLLSLGLLSFEIRSGAYPVLEKEHGLLINFGS